MKPSCVAWAMAICLLAAPAAVLGAPPATAVAPALNSAAGFAVLGGATVTNVGATALAGSLGLNPGVSVTGFPPGVLTSGAIYIADATAQLAQADLAQAYGALAGEACGQDLSGTDLGGQTLTPGVYCFSAAAQLTGTLTLDGQGDPSAVFVFQVGSTLTSAVGATIVTVNSTQPCNVFWQVGSSATVGAGTTWTGDILAAVSITLGSGANLAGRALAQSGAVTLGANQVEATACAPIPPCQGAVNGTPCNDGDGCTQTDTCQANVCVGANPVLCASGGACALPGTCAPATGLCSYPVPPCGTSSGDPHLRTFDGLLYNLMAVGDFLLVHTPDLTIQVRQTRFGTAVAINTAAVVQMGADRVRFLRQTHQVLANGVALTSASVPVPLAGGTLCSRHGDVILLHSAHADVGVRLSGSLLNFSVSLPPEVTDISGLLGSRDGDPHNDLMARTGELLPLSVTSARFYAVFAASWAVAPADSLFGAAVPARTPVAAGALPLAALADAAHFSPPPPAFTATDLPVAVRAAATAVCVAKGVADPDLLAACTLDVAVLADPAAADVFVAMPPPRAVVYLAEPIALPPTVAASPSPVAAAPAAVAAGCHAGAAGPPAALLGASLAVALVFARRSRRNR